jgi:hypothetical protein
MRLHAFCFQLFQFFERGLRDIGKQLDADFLQQAEDAAQLDGFLAVLDVADEDRTKVSAAGDVVEP